MAAPRDHQWTLAEKNYLLAEIIKAHSPHPSVLLNVIASLNIQPNWNDIPLPPGRSVNSSRLAYDQMRQNQAQPPSSMLSGALGPQTPSPLSAPITLKRNYPFEASHASGREIRPKLPSVGPAYGQPAPIEHPPKKKRGRPTKAEAEAKAAAAQASTSDSGPARSQPTSLPLSASSLAQQPSEPTPPHQPPAEATKPPLPPTTRMPISSILTPTGPKSASQSSGSSGKRRRGRSTRSEPDELPSSASFGAQQQRPQLEHAYESPYARVPSAFDDTPARTAMLRHSLRDDSLGSEGHPPPQQPQPLPLPQPQHIQQQPPGTGPSTSTSAEPSSATSTHPPLYSSRSPYHGAPPPPPPQP